MANPSSWSTLSHQWDSLEHLDGVRVFVAIAELKSFRRAAKALGVPRSTVSRRLAALEAALATRLLQRTTREVHVTEAGQHFLQQVAPAVSAIADAGRSLLGASQTPKGLVRVTATPPMAEALGEVMLELLATYPEMRVELDFTDRQVDLVREGYDIGIRAGALPDSSLMTRPLGQGVSGYFASPKYLKGRGPLEVPSDLDHHECIVFSGSSRGARWMFSKGKKVLHHSVRGRVVANSMPFARIAAVKGFGVAWLPMVTALDEVERGRLAPVLEAWWPPLAPLQLVYPSSRHLAPQVRVTLDLLAERLKFGPGALLSGR